MELDDLIGPLEHPGPVADGQHREPLGRVGEEAVPELGLGGDVEGSADATFDATREGNYPDAIVQILSLAGSPRAGDVILSAAPGWDFRARYEPIPHRSSHGALHRDHMMVPLLLNRPAAGTPRRTTDLFASALDALGVQAPASLDGGSFLRPGDRAR